MEGRSAGAISKRQVTAFLVAALVLGGGGLGLGVYSLTSGGQQGPAGPTGDQGGQGLLGDHGDQGPQGDQGPAGMVGPVVGITQPGNNSVVASIASVRVMLWNSTPCTFEVLVNGSLNATEVPWQWNTSAPQFKDGWWNLTVRATNATGGVGQDSVMVYVYNTRLQFFHDEPTTVPPYPNLDATLREFTHIEFNTSFTSTVHVRSTGQFATGPEARPVYFCFKLDGVIEISWYPGYWEQFWAAYLVCCEVRYNYTWINIAGVFNNVAAGSHNASLWYMDANEWPGGTLYSESYTYIYVGIDPP